MLPTLATLNQRLAGVDIKIPPLHHPGLGKPRVLQGEKLLVVQGSNLIAFLS